jgi:hypothetical protein
MNGEGHHFVLTDRGFSDIAISGNRHLRPVSGANRKSRRTVHHQGTDISNLTDTELRKLYRRKLADVDLRLFFLLRIHLCLLDDAVALPVQQPTTLSVTNL